MKAADVMADLVARLVAAIEAGADGWRMPWRTLAVRGWPTNAVTGIGYRGGNVLALHLAADDHGYPTGRWATYRQWEQVGAQVRKGERATPAVKWVTKARPGTDHTTTERTPADGDDTPTRLIPVGFALFNAAQVDGDPHPATDTEPADAATTDERFAGWLAPIPARVIWGGNRAYYSPATDTVHVPTPGQFTDPDALGATVAHELAHWTGHPDRLARDLTGRFGDDAYAVEELVAELSAAFTCATLGPGQRRPQQRPRRLPRLVVPCPARRTSRAVERRQQGPSSHRPPPRLQHRIGARGGGLVNDAPGPQRLFPVDADDQAPLHVLDADGRLVTTTHNLAAAAIAAAAAAHRHGRAWLVAVDRWSVALDASAADWHPIGADGAPLDAIRRVLTTLNRKELDQP